MSPHRLRALVVALGLTLVSTPASASRPKVKVAKSLSKKSLRTQGAGKLSRERKGRPQPGTKETPTLKAQATKTFVLKAKGTQSASLSKKAPAKEKENLFALRSEVREFQKSFAAANRAISLKNQGADAHVSKVMRHSEKRGEYFTVSDLHWGKGMGPNHQFRPQEDFRKSQAFAKFVTHISGMKRSSLVVGGDWLEFMEHVDANTPLSQVKKTLTQILEGHHVETKAIAQAVGKKGLRMIYIAGNHDVHLVNPEVRSHLVNEMARIGALSPAEAKLLGERVAYSGHGAVLGKFGEGLVVHGHAQDRTNNWRSVANPYNAKRELQSNLGWNIVKNIFRRIERRRAEIDNMPLSSTKAVLGRIIRNPIDMKNALKTLWQTLGQRESFGKGGELSQRLDDRVTLRSWTRRTGFAKKMSAPIPGAAKLPSSESATTHQLEAIYGAQPTPVLESMKSKSRLVNLVRSVVTLGKQMRETKNAEPKFLSQLTSSFSNLRHVIWGHNHFEAEWHGSAGKGQLAHFNTGTWTRVNGEWRLNVVRGSTDGNGRLTMKGVFRTNAETGVPNLPNAYAKENAPSVPGWNN